MDTFGFKEDDGSNYLVSVVVRNTVTNETKNIFFGPAQKIRNYIDKIGLHVGAYKYDQIIVEYFVAWDLCYNITLVTQDVYDPIMFEKDGTRMFVRTMSNSINDTHFDFTHNKPIN